MMTLPLLPYSCQRAGKLEPNIDKGFKGIARVAITFYKVNKIKDIRVFSKILWHVWHFPLQEVTVLINFWVTFAWIFKCKAKLKK